MKLFKATKNYHAASHACACTVWGHADAMQYNNPSKVPLLYNSQRIASSMDIGERNYIDRKKRIIYLSLFPLPVHHSHVVNSSVAPPNNIMCTRLVHYACMAGACTGPNRRETGGELEAR